MAVNQTTVVPRICSVDRSEATRQELEAWNLCETCRRMTQIRESGRSPVTGFWVLAAGPALRDMRIVPRWDAPPLQAFFTLQPSRRPVNTDSPGASQLPVLFLCSAKTQMEYLTVLQLL